MLVGEDLGGSHDRALESTLDCSEQSSHGNDRLARPNLSLQQAMHRMGRRHVVLDLGDRPRLGTRHLIGKGFEERLDEAPVAVVRDALGEIDLTMLAYRQGDLEPKQFVEHQARSSRLGCFDLVREVDVADRCVPIQQAETFTHCGREWIGHGTRLQQRRVDRPAQVPGADAPHRRVNRHDPAGHQRFRGPVQHIRIG